MPVSDWQFWTVTVAALIAAVVLVWPLFPRRRGKKTEITVRGKPPER